MLNFTPITATPTRARACPFNHENLAPAIAAFKNSILSLPPSDINEEKLVECVGQAAKIPELDPQMSAILAAIPKNDLLSLLAKPVLYELAAPYLAQITQNVFECIDHSRKRCPAGLGLGYFEGIDSIIPIPPPDLGIDQWLLQGELPYSRNQGLDPDYFVPIPAEDLRALQSGKCPDHFVRKCVFAELRWKAGQQLQIDPSDSKAQELLGFAKKLYTAPYEVSRKLLPDIGINELDAMHTYLKSNLTILETLAVRARCLLMQKYEPHQFKLQSELLAKLPQREGKDLGMFYLGGFDTSAVFPLELLRVGIYSLVRDLNSGRASKFGQDFNVDTVKSLFPSLREATFSHALGSLEDFSRFIEVAATKHAFGFRLNNNLYNLVPGVSEHSFNIITKDPGLLAVSAESQKPHATVGCPGKKLISRIADHVWAQSMEFVVPNFDKFSAVVEAELFSTNNS